jgi:hypothetical protein
MPKTWELRMNENETAARTSNASFLLSDIFKISFLHIEYIDKIGHFVYRDICKSCILFIQIMHTDAKMRRAHQKEHIGKEHHINAFRE